MALLAGLGGPVGGQRLTATEWSVAGLATLARRDFYGAGLGWGVRPGTQGRVAIGAAGGVLAGGRAEGGALRLEVTAQFILNPGARSGVTLYGGVGAALLAAAHAPGQGYATVLVGVETAAGRRRGWFVELGAGGGVRLAAGWRWRRFPAGWR